VQIPSDRQIDEAVGRWTNDRASVEQAYAEKMHASNGSRLKTFTRVYRLSRITTCPIQALVSDNAKLEKGELRG
jgi:hypothetical protein